MSRLRAMVARIRGHFGGRDADAELREEFEAHLEMETAEFVRRGMSPADARREALLASGGITQATEAVRARRGIPALTGLVSDIRFAFRSLARAPLFTVVVVLTLALGIGANIAIFSVVRAVLLKPLPHDGGDRLVYLRHAAVGRAPASLGLSIPEVRDLRAATPSFIGLAEYSPWFHTLVGEGEATRLDVALVSGDFFEVLGLSPTLGRLTTRADDRSDARAVMVLTHALWMSRFRGDSSVLGREVHLDASTATIIGVLEPAPFFPDAVDALLNTVISVHHVSATMVEGRTHRMTEVIARLAPGTDLAQARAEVDSAFARMRRAHPEAYDAQADHRLSVLPFKQVMAERARLTLWLLIGAAAFVMVVAAANVTNLTLMRGVRRAHELVVRAALGAAPGRLRRLLLVENFALAAVGAMFGIALALGGVPLLASLVARYSPRADEVRLDLAVLAFTVALTLAVALLLSFAAALPKDGAFASLAAGSGRTSASLRRHGLQRALVVSQVAASVVLLAGAGLLTRTVMRLSRVDTGLRADQVLTIPVSLLDPSRLSFGEDAANKARYREMQAGIGALPGVRAVALGSTMPLRKSGLDFAVRVEGRTDAANAAGAMAELRTASPEYFRAAGIPLRQGREFGAGDSAGATRVAIVNSAFAARQFPGGDAIGRRVAFVGEVMRFTPISTDWRTIIGVVADTRDGGLDAEPRLVVFAPFDQELTMLGGLVVRTDGDAAALAAAATRIVRRIAPSASLDDVMTVTQIREQSVRPRRLNAVLASSFGILAVLIAAVGIAGVLAFSVSARTIEIGIMMSLGADGRRVQRMILREGGSLLLIGIALGLAGILVTGGAMRGLLFGVSPRDPATFIAVVLLVAAIGLVACWIPALRASRVDPAIAMRS